MTVRRCDCPALALALANMGRHWGWVLAFGLINVAAGVLALAWPGRTLVVIAVIFGVELVVAGIFRFVAAFAAEDESGTTALALLLGIFWMVNGFVEVFIALAYRDMPHRGLAIATGPLSIVAGFIVLVYPKISLLTLTIVLGVWLLIFGVMEIVLAFRLRSARAPSTAPLGAPLTQA